MKSNPLLLNNTKNNDFNEELLLNKNINNKLYYKKRKLPKLNTSNLSNSVDNYQSIFDKNNKKKKKIVLLSLNNPDKNNYSKEILEAKEIKDLEKIYDKWLHREKKG